MFQNGRSSSSRPRQVGDSRVAPRDHIQFKYSAMYGSPRCDPRISLVVQEAT